VKDHPLLFSAPMVRANLEERKTQTRRILKPQPPEWATFCQQPTMLNVLHEWVPSGLWAWSENEQVPPRKLRRWPLDAEGQHYWLRPRYSVGDRLWVREAHYLTDDGDHELAVYAADADDVRLHLAGVEQLRACHPNIDWSKHARLRPSIHMPRWASRLTLIVTGVKIERLQDISEEDAIAEGIDRVADNYGNGPAYCDYLLGKPHDTAEWYRSPIDSYRSLWDHINGPCAWDKNPWVVAYSYQPIFKNIDQINQA